MRGTVSVGNLISTNKTQAVTLNIGAGVGNADVRVLLTSSLPNATVPAAAGSLVTFTAGVSDVPSGSVPGTMSVLFTGPVTINPASLPAACVLNTVVAQAVDCSFTTPQTFAIPVTVGFARTVTAQAFVASGAADTDPTNNQATATVQVRPRPFSRNGLPVIIP